MAGCLLTAHESPGRCTARKTGSVAVLGSIANRIEGATAETVSESRREGESPHDVSSHHDSETVSAATQNSIRECFREFV